VVDYSSVWSAGSPVVGDTIRVGQRFGRTNGDRVR